MKYLIAQQRMQKHSSQGFTLIELLVAMAIFATLAVMAYGGLGSVIKASTGVQARITNLETLQRTFMLLERDIRQLVPRQANTDSGAARPSLDAGGGEGTLFEFTRGGRPNPADDNRSSLFRVAYVLEEGQLKRLIWEKVDHLYSDEPIEMKLLNNVQKVTIKLLDGRGQWQPKWGENNGSALPTAVEIIVDHEKWGEIRRLIPVYGY